MNRKPNRFIYWTPRVLSIVFIIFLTLMSLDVFEEGKTIWEIIVGLFMHNIPSLILLIILIISWKYEIVGGIVFILVGLIYVIIVAMHQPWLTLLVWSLLIAGPAFLIGFLFMFNWFKREH